MAANSVAVVNMALQQIASQSQIIALTDTTPEGIAASLLYAQCVQLCLREMSPEFARKQAALVLNGLAAPAPWAFDYTYPSDCVGIRQVMPASSNANDPQPVRWFVHPVIVMGSSVNAIATNQIGALLVYTTNAVVEPQWDNIFTESVVRMLASELAMPIGGRPDFAKQKLTEVQPLMQSNYGKDS